MKQSLGLVEIIGLPTAVFVADAMVKAANVHIIEMENSKGLGYMTIKIQGNIGAVKAAVDAGCQLGRICGKLAGCKVIPRPSDDVEQTFCSLKGSVPSALPEPAPEVTELSNGSEAKTKEAPEQLNLVPAKEADEVEILKGESKKPVNAGKKPISGTAKKTSRKTSHEKGDD